MLRGRELRFFLPAILWSLALVLTAPNLATAYNYWSVTATTSPSSAAGAITPPSGPDYSTSGNVTNIVTSTVTTADYTINANPPGFRLNYVNIDGVNYFAPNNGTTYRVNKGTKVYHTLTAYYSATSYLITTSKSGIGTIDPSVWVPIGSTKTINMTAGVGYKIGSVTAVGATLTGGDGISTASYTFTNIQSNKSVSVSFVEIPVVTARITTSPQTIVAGNPLVIDGSASTYTVTPTYTWSLTPTNGATLTPAADGRTATFLPTNTGNYTIKLILSAAGATSTEATVAISVTTQASADSEACTDCHSDRNPSIVSGYNSSRHAGTATVSCRACHNPTGELMHPYDVRPYDICGGCHFDPQGEVPLHPVAINGNPCVSCHDPHSALALVGAPPAHFNNQTSAGYPASYLTSRSACVNCHYGSQANPAIREQWALSGHAATLSAAWRGEDFKTRSGCVQCHSTTGFIAYSSGKVTAAWGVASDKTKEVLSCVGCHSDMTMGNVRNVTPVRPFADDSFVNRNVGKSNICLDCHSGVNNGMSIQIKVENGDFGNLPFVAPHYAAAGATLQGVGGYHFPGVSYASYSSSGHRDIGVGNKTGTGTGGPCVSCHMSAPEKHRYRAVTRDQAGVLDAIVTTTCSNCHQGSLDAAKLTAGQNSFLDALEALRALLAQKGFPYSPSAPHFANTNWGSGQEGANAMGAAYNYALLKSEPGVYAHNPLYAKQLVLDSIDWLDNNQLDDSVLNLALPTLVDAGAISQATADSVAAYQPKKDSCLTCHGGSAATATPMATNGHPAHITRPYGPGLYLGGEVAPCQQCHAASSANHLNGVVDLWTGAGSACVGCHAGTPPTWSSTARIDCTVCHAAAPARLPNGVAAPYKPNFAVTGHGRFAASNQCSVCHDPDSSHISGTLGTFMRLRVPNDNNLCASCHNDPGVVGVAFRNMSTHVTKEGNPLSCRDCHEPHGTGNLSMIRTTINGNTIVFNDRENGLVNPATNRGLCQACHTLTNYYRAGIPETRHYTSGCLSCHTHNAAGGAFKPIGGTCDSCHGYPPAPKNTGMVFGTENNWINARFEDYSGGGGAHLAIAHVSPLAVASEGWQNCTVCHNGGDQGASSYHRMTTPVQSHIDNVTVLVDPRLRFAEGFTVYTGARLFNLPAQNETGNCFNIACHMSPSPRWSTER